MCNHRDSFGDNEDSSLFPLQEAPSSTLSTNIPLTYNAKNNVTSASGSTASSSCTTPSTACVKKISHHTSPPTAKELAYLEERNVQYQSTSRSPGITKTEENSPTFEGLDIKVKPTTFSEDTATTHTFSRREKRGRASHSHDVLPCDLPQHPKMRVVYPPRGAHHMYSPASSSSSSVSSGIQDTQRETKASQHVRKRHYIIFDENDEDTLI